MSSLFNEDQKYILPVYKRIDIEISHGEGSYLITKDGNKYLDMFSGISVNNLGVSHPEIIERIKGQVTKYIHLSNYFLCEVTVNLARLLVENSDMSKVFFTNSGTEANEAAIKLARKYGKQLSQDKYEVLTSTNSFHGRTYGGLTLTGQEKYNKAFTPLLPGVNHFNFNDLDDLRNKVSSRTCAVFIEIIQGEGGINEVSETFIKGLTTLANQYQFLIVIDEIQTGLGRTGDLFSYEKYKIKPDIVTIAKSLGGGLPLGAMLVNERLENVFARGEHGSTFGGNPVACACGEYLVTQFIDESFKNAVKEKGAYLIRQLEIMRRKYSSIIKDIRGRGLMIGIETEQAELIKDEAFKRHLLLNVTNKNVIRLLPQLLISETEMNEFLNTFEEILFYIINQKAS